MKTRRVQQHQFFIEEHALDTRSCFSDTLHETLRRGLDLAVRQEEILGRLSIGDEAINQVGDAPSTDLNDPRINQAVAAIAEYANAPIDVFLDNHAALSEAYRDLRASDEGREWSNLLTACIAQRVLEHQAGIAIQQQLVARRAQVAQAPIKEEVEADHAKQLESDNAAAEQARADAAEQQQAGMVDKMVEYNDKDQERELKREMKAAEILANSEPQPATSPPAA